MAACDRDPAALDRFLTRFPRARGFGDLETMLKEARPDAVYLATPNHAHRGPAEVCAAAGVPVLCEKPLAHDVRDAAALVGAFGEAGVPLATAFDQRFHPAHVLLREMVAAGELGTVTHARVHYACWLPADWSPDGADHDNWRVDRNRAGGGAAIDLAPHGLDLLAVTLGAEWEALFALTHTAVQDYAVDDGAVLTRPADRTAARSRTCWRVCTSATTPPTPCPAGGWSWSARGPRPCWKTRWGRTPAGGSRCTTPSTGGRRDVPFDSAADPFARQAAAFGACVERGGAFPFPAVGDLRRHELLLNALARANAERRAA